MKSTYSILAICLVLFICLSFCSCERNTLAESTIFEETQYQTQRKGKDDTQISNTKTLISLSSEYNKDLSEYGYTYFGESKNDIDIYAFTDEKGTVNYRSACVVKTVKDGNTVDVVHSICSVKETDDGKVLPLQVIDDAKEEKDEKFGKPVVSVPNENQIPAGYNKVENINSCFYYTDKNGEKVYRTYAAYPEFKPAFYPSDSKGNIPLGALKIDLLSDVQNIASVPSPTATQKPAATPTPTPTTPAFFIGDAPYVVVDDVSRETLININFRLSKDYVPTDLVKVIDYIDTTLVTLSSNNARANPEATQAFSEMMTAAKYDGVTGYILKNTYRSYREQENLWNYRVSQNKKYGRTLYEPLGSAYPGSSEHQTGYAFDITCLSSPFANISFRNTENFNWLTKNSYKYGFILRYNADKTRLTGIKFEPYHYRYVGVDLATYLYENNLCLEEYYNSPLVWK